MAAEWYTDSKQHSVELLDELFLVLHDSYNNVSNRCQLYHFAHQIPMKQRQLPMSFFIPPNQLRSMTWPGMKSALESHYFPALSNQLKDPFNQVYASLEVTSTTLKYQQTVQLSEAGFTSPASMTQNLDVGSHLNQTHCSPELNFALESHPHQSSLGHDSNDCTKPYWLINFIPRSYLEEMKREPSSRKFIQNTLEPCYRIVNEWIPCDGQEFLETKTSKHK